MRIQSISRLALVGLVTAGAASAQNDECATATAVMLGATAFDTTTATLSPEVWPCAGGGGPDLWYTYTAASTNDIVIETCGSSYDTALEVFTGACGALVPFDCNDDACGLQSRITIASPTVGTVYTFRVGGWSSSTGAGTLTVSEQLPPPTNCLETLYAANNGGAVGGAVYFDLTVTQNVSISGLELNTSVNGSPVGLEVYTIPTTYVGNAGSSAGWTLAASDDGTAIGAGAGSPTAINFLAPMTLAPGTYGIALIGDNSTTGLQLDHDYTNGNGTNQNYASLDGVLSLSAGAADNTPFAGGGFTPRVWNGKFCHGAGGIGVPYCGPAVANSTGASATMSASGSATVANNDLVLEANDLPLNAFGFFLTSTTQGFSPMPGGSAGNLCLGGSIGRFVGPGQIQNSGSTGSISLATDNSQWPTPGGLIQVNAGETWNCQAWYRDMSMGGGATSNFTDGLEITFN